MTSRHDKETSGSSFWTKGTGSSTAALATGQAATALGFVIIARRLEPEQFGPFVALYGATLFAGGLLDFGSSQRMLRELSRGSGLATYRPWLVRRTQLQLPLALAFMIIVQMMVDIPLSWFAVAALGAQSVTYPVCQGALAAVGALRRPQEATWMVAAGNTLLLLVAILSPYGILLEAAAVTAASSWAVTTALALRSVSELLPTEDEPAGRNPWQGSRSFGIGAIAFSAQTLHVPLVGLAAGPLAAAFAGAVSRWTQPVQLLSAGYTSQVFPLFAQSTSNRSALRHLRGVVPVLAAGLLFVALLWWPADQIVSVVLGPQYSESGTVLRWYALSALPLLILRPLNAFLLARGSERFAAWTNSIAATISTLAVGPLAAAIGPTAAPITLMIWFSVITAIFLGRAIALSSPVRPP